MLPRYACFIFTTQVVPALLRAMYGMLDRLAGLQLALQPPRITQAYTGLSVVNYGVRLWPKAGGGCAVCTHAMLIIKSPLVTLAVSVFQLNLIIFMCVCADNNSLNPAGPNGWSGV